MKTNNQKIKPEATHTYFYDGWLLIKETRHPAASQSGSDAAGSRVSMEVAGVALGRRDVLSRRVWNGRLKLAKHRPQR